MGPGRSRSEAQRWEPARGRRGGSCWGAGTCPLVAGRVQRVPLACVQFSENAAGVHAVGNLLHLLKSKARYNNLGGRVGGSVG